MATRKYHHSHHRRNHDASENPSEPSEQLSCSIVFIPTEQTNFLMVLVEQIEIGEGSVQSHRAPHCSESCLENKKIFLTIEIYLETYKCKVNLRSRTLFNLFSTSI